MIYFRHCDTNAIIDSTELDEKGYGLRLRSTYNEKKLQLPPFSYTTSNFKLLQTICYWLIVQSQTTFLYTDVEHFP
jgi:hypothetical protein